MTTLASDTGKNVLEYITTLGILAMEGRGFEYPTDTVIAKNGRLYVTNRSRDMGERGVRVTVLDIDSEYYGTFGHYGQGEGQLISPMAAGVLGAIWTFMMFLDSLFKVVLSAAAKGRAYSLLREDRFWAGLLAASAGFMMYYFK